MDWARAARSYRERAIFLQMAQTWLFAAARLDPCFPSPIEPMPAGQTSIFSADGTAKAAASSPSPDKS